VIEAMRRQFGHEDLDIVRAKKAARSNGRPSAFISRSSGGGCRVASVSAGHPPDQTCSTEEHRQGGG